MLSKHRLIKVRPRGVDGAFKREHSSFDPSSDRRANVGVA